MGPEANASQAQVTGSAGNSIVRSIFNTLTLTRKPALQEIPAPELETAQDLDNSEQPVSSDEFTLLTTMLVEVKFELANTQEEVMRLKRDLKRCINDKLEACRRVRISLFHYRRCTGHLTLKNICLCLKVHSFRIKVSHTGFHLFRKQDHWCGSTAHA